MSREELKRLRRQLLGVSRQVADMVRLTERILMTERDAPGATGSVGVADGDGVTDADGAAGAADMKQAEEIVQILNNTCKTRFSVQNDETIALIRARLDEGYTTEDFKRVIGVCYAAWSDEPKMRIYLRPATLFGDRFESYLQAATGTDHERVRELEGMLIERQLRG